MPTGITWNPTTHAEHEHQIVFGTCESKCKEQVTPLWFDTMMKDTDRFYYDYDKSTGTEYLKKTSDGSVFATRQTTTVKSNGISTIDMIVSCPELGQSYTERWKNDANGNWTGGDYNMAMPFDGANNALLEELKVLTNELKTAVANVKTATDNAYNAANAAKTAATNANTAANAAKTSADGAKNAANSLVNGVNLKGPKNISYSAIQSPSLSKNQTLLNITGKGIAVVSSQSSNNSNVKIVVDGVTKQLPINSIYEDKFDFFIPFSSSIEVTLTVQSGNTYGSAAAMGIFE